MADEEQGTALIDAAIAQYNGEREGVAKLVGWRVPVFVGGFLAGVIAIAYVLGTSMDDFMSTPSLILYVAAGFAIFWIYGLAMQPATDLQAGLRDKALPIVFGFVEDLRLSRGFAPAGMGELPKETVGTFNREAYDDVISGKHDGLWFELAEATLSQKAGKSTQTLFKGVIFIFPLEKAYPGTLIAIRRSNVMMKWLTETFSSSPLRHVEGADRALEEDYDFRTDNDQAARGLIAGSMGKVLHFLMDNWSRDNPPRLALRGSQGFLLLPQERNYFELPGINTPLSRQGHIEPMAHELKLLLASAQLASKVGT